MYEKDFLHTHIVAQKSRLRTSQTPYFDCDNNPCHNIFSRRNQQWRGEGRWEQMQMKLGHEAEPGMAIIDSQSVKTTEKEG